MHTERVFLKVNGNSLGRMLTLTTSFGNFGKSKGLPCNACPVFYSLADAC